MKRWIYLLLVSILLAACGPSDEALEATVESRVQVAVVETVAAIPTQTPYPTPTRIPEPTQNPISDAFKSQLSTFLQATNAVTAATTQGVTYVELRRLVNEARGTYDLTVALWPEGVSPAAQADFDKAFEGWDLTLYLWNAELDDLDNPVEPDINRYEAFVRYSDLLILDRHPSNFIVRDYRDKLYVSFDNIPLLMTLAADYFESGQSTVVQFLD